MIRKFGGTHQEMSGAKTSKANIPDNQPAEAVPRLDDVVERALYRLSSLHHLHLSQHASYSCTQGELLFVVPQQHLSVTSIRVA